MTRLLDQHEQAVPGYCGSVGFLHLRTEDWIKNKKTSLTCLFPVTDTVGSSETLQNISTERIIISTALTFGCLPAFPYLPLDLADFSVVLLIRFLMLTKEGASLERETFH